MVLTGKQKAAMLLMSLDVATAAKLLKGINPEAVQELAVELTSLDESGLCNKREQTKVVKEFCSLLRKGSEQEFHIGRFLNEILIKVVGEEKAKQIQSQIKQLTAQKDMFVNIRSANVDELVVALEGEHPQTIAVILSELVPKKSQEVLSLLNEETRSKTVLKMTNPDLQGVGVKKRMASIVGERLKSLKGTAFVAKPGRQEENLRKLAIVLSGLEQDLRDQLLGEICKNDEETGKTVRLLMVTWEDILTIADKSLQEALRTVDSSKLAIALYGADEDIAQKIRSNNSYT
ncbi:MAG: FliG C-terminal domain-containing protein [Planctomycetota bacterium]